jgi:hypothetical protein
MGDTTMQKNENLHDLANSRTRQSVTKFEMQQKTPSLIHQTSVQEQYKA